MRSTMLNNGIRPSLKYHLQANFSAHCSLPPPQPEELNRLSCSFLPIIYPRIALQILRRPQFSEIEANSRLNRNDQGRLTRRTVVRAQRYGRDNHARRNFPNAQRCIRNKPRSAGPARIRLNPFCAILVKNIGKFLGHKTQIDPTQQLPSRYLGYRFQRSLSKQPPFQRTINWSFQEDGYRPWRTFIDSQGNCNKSFLAFCWGRSLTSRKRGSAYEIVISLE